MGKEKIKRLDQISDGNTLKTSLCNLNRYGCLLNLDESKD